MPAASLRLVVHGAAGRMGRRVVALACEDAAIETVAGVEYEGNSLLGTDVAALAGLAPRGIALQSQWPQWVADGGPGRAVIDFSLPTAVDGCVEHCVKADVPLVVATTGLEPEQHETLRMASRTIPICWAPSMSLTVNLTMRLAQQVTAALKDIPGGIDVEIIERHRSVQGRCTERDGTEVRRSDR